jgi:hypothetical protein
MADDPAEPVPAEPLRAQIGIVLDARRRAAAAELQRLSAPHIRKANDALRAAAAAGEHHAVIVLECERRVADAVRASFAGSGYAQVNLNAHVWTHGIQQAKDAWDLIVYITRTATK